MIAAYLLSAFLCYAHPVQQQEVFIADEKEVVADSIVWMSLDDVNKIVEKNIKKNKVKEEKLILVDFYTDWCGWCVKLDRETYRDASVIEEMNKYFYAVKFNAELRDSVQFANKIYGYKGSGARVTNEFAITMATRPGGRIGYPTMTIITPMGEKVAVEGGYKDPGKMLLMLRYYGEGFYKTMDYQTFLQQKPREADSSEFSD